MICTHEVPLIECSLFALMCPS